MEWDGDAVEVRICCRKERLLFFIFLRIQGKE